MNLPHKKIEVVDRVEAGRRIRTARKKARISLSQLADYMKISAGNLHELEHGLRKWDENNFRLAAHGISQLKTAPPK